MSIVDNYYYLLLLLLLLFLVIIAIIVVRKIENSRDPERYTRKTLEYSKHDSIPIEGMGKSMQ